MQQLQQAEQSRAAAAQAKNELEAYIITTQGRLGDDKEVQAVSSDKQRIGFQADLGKVEEWLYDQGEHEQAPVFRCDYTHPANTSDPSMIALLTVCTCECECGCVGLWVCV